MSIYTRTLVRVAMQEVNKYYQIFSFTSLFKGYIFWLQKVILKVLSNEIAYSGGV